MTRTLEAWERIESDEHALRFALRVGSNMAKTRWRRLQRTDLAGAPGTMLGDVLCRRGRWMDAEPFIDESRHLAADDDIDAQVGWRIAMGRALGAQGKTESDEVLSEAVAVGERTDYISHTADALMTLAQTRYEMGLGGESVPAARRAWGLYKRKESLVMAERASALLDAISKQKRPPDFGGVAPGAGESPPLRRT